MRAFFFVLTCAVCAVCAIAIAKPQLGYDYSHPAFQSNGLQHQSFASTPLQQFLTIPTVSTLSGQRKFRNYQPLPTLSTPAEQTTFATSQPLALPLTLPTLSSFAAQGSLQQDLSLFGQQPYYASQPAQSSMHTYYDNSIPVGTTPHIQFQHNTEQQQLSSGLTQGVHDVNTFNTFTTQNQLFEQIPSVELQRLPTQLSQDSVAVNSFNTQRNAAYDIASTSQPQFESVRAQQTFPLQLAAQPTEGTTLKTSNGYEYESGQQLQLQQQSNALDNFHNTAGTLNSFQIYSTLAPNPADIAVPALPPVNTAFDQNAGDQGTTVEIPHLPQSRNVLPAEQTQPEIQPQRRATIHKHVYVHLPPPEFEEEEEQQDFPAVVAEKNKRYNIIFIKAPSLRQSSIVRQVQPQNEDKTIIYVLVKKPEPHIITPIQTGVKHEKPEVYFIKYKAQKGTAVVPADSPAFVEQSNFAEPIVVERSKPESSAEGRTEEAIEAEMMPDFEKQPEAPLPTVESVDYTNQTENTFEPTRSPAAGVSPIPIDLASKYSKMPPKNTLKPKQHYLPAH